jgi:serine/threonine-protein kinase
MPPPNKNNRTDGFGGSGRPRHTPGARRVMVMAGVVVALGAVTYGWSLVAANRNDSRPQQPSVLAAEGKCVVSYAVITDTGTTFKANVTVANRDTVPAADWKLWFLMPGDQLMSGNGTTSLFQQDQAVTVQSAAALDPQQSKTVQITGQYKESNAAPMVFQLNHQTCEAYVSGKPNAPSRPVERLTDGTTRLGPVPTTRNPAPGITISPGGVAVPVPIKTSTKPTKTRGPVASVSPTPKDPGGGGHDTPLPSPPPSDEPTTSPTPSQTPTPIDTPATPVIGGGECTSPDPLDC